jgi:hypothetical protein
MLPQTVAPLTPKQKAKHLRLVNDLPYYCKNVLKIQTKDPNAPLQALSLNKAQLYIHEQAEDQKRRTGKVRKIIIKGRQQGASTYITARFYHKATMNPNSSIYILSHEADSTEILFEKVKTYYEQSGEVIRPNTDTDNRKTFSWHNGSKYGVGTAKAEGTGRSGMNHYFHASEPAHYPKGENVQSGALQTVPNADGTEIFLETTANGLNWFYTFTMAAVEGKGAYEVIFVPWYWSDEYREKPVENFEVTEEEAKLKVAYGLDDWQIQWRRNKIVELRVDEKASNPERLFKQEYPFTLDEAFQFSGEPFYDPNIVNIARKSKLKDYDSPIIIGCDPGRDRDRTAIIVRQGRQFRDLKVYPTMKTGELTGILANMIDDMEADKCFIDYGMGYGVVDNLVDLGYGSIVQGISFSEGANDVQYLNKRAEMFHLLRDWFEEGEVSIPDSNDISTDLACIPQPTPNNIGKISFVDKKTIRKLYRKSPDIADAMILTFAFPVRRKGGSLIPIRTTNTKRGSAFQTLRNVRNIRDGDKPQDGMTDNVRKAISREWREGRQWGF